MKRKTLTKHKYCLYLFIAIAFVASILHGPGAEPKTADAAITVSTPTPTMKLIGITAYYTKADAVIIGQDFLISDVKVEATYTNGDHEVIKTGFSVSSTTVTKDGDNTFMVMYKGYQTTFNVKGKEMAFITAFYSGEAIPVGEYFKDSSVTVYAMFTDGTSERVAGFSVNSHLVSNVGENTYTVSYLGKTSQIEVPGKATRSIVSLFVNYVGGPLTVGNAPDRKNIRVLATYSDHTSEEVDSFTVSPSVAFQEGMNVFVVGYGGISASFEVFAEERMLVWIDAVYVGTGELQGKLINKKNIEVTGHYMDGSTGLIEEYSLDRNILYEIGEEIVIIKSEMCTYALVIPVVEAVYADYSNSYETVITGGGYATAATIALPSKMKKEDITTEKVGNALIKKVVRYATTSNKFFGFDINLINDEWASEFPFTMKVVRPQEIDPDKFAVYYTPNKKTVMAKLNGEYIDPEKTVYEFSVADTGTYVLLEEESKKLVTDIQTFSKEVKIKVGKYSSPEIYVIPADAANRNVTYITTDSKIATVSETGKIKGIAEGKCQVIVKALDGSGVETVLDITVTAK